MDLAKVLQQLYQELENLNAAISSLERLQESTKGRDKNAEWLQQVTKSPGTARKRKRTIPDSRKQPGLRGSG